MKRGAFAVAFLCSLAVVIVVLNVVALRAVVFLALWKPPTQPGRNQDKCPPGGSRLAKDEYSDSGIVTVIRLTDDGEFADRCELTEAIYEIRNPPDPELIVWYVHGWKHNAQKNDSDLRHFKELIATLNKKQLRLDEGNRRHVVGVYVGWDGAVGPSFLQDLTFWNRKRAADRISQSSVLIKIIAATKYARQQMGDLAARDLTIMIGHSFGARILYAATSQVLIDQVQRRHPGFAKDSYGVIEGPADLILLLNPAFEASMFTAMDSIRRPDYDLWEGFDPGQAPLLLVLASENDWATRMAFPLGQRLELAQMARQCTTLGNYRDYITHNLEQVESGYAPPKENHFWYDHFEAQGLRLRRTTDYGHPGNPFIVARTTKDIINGHNKIWGKKLRKWIVSFLWTLQQRRSTPLERQ
jgi:hypothetical protein